MSSIVLHGNVVEEPRLNFTQSGKAVANFNVAENHRKWSDSEDRWIDDGVTYYPIVAWQGLAEHVGNTLQKGMHVTIVGRLREREFEITKGDNAGQVRRTIEVIADDVAINLRFGLHSSLTSVAENVRPTRKRTTRRK